jgi:Flp pilus assembly protein TadB
MSQPGLPHPDYPLDRKLDLMLLRGVQYVVPAPSREDWMRTWHSELWYLHHRKPSGARHTATLAAGIARDAFWLRTESWKAALHGTAALCLAVLAGLCLLCAGIALLLTGSVREFAMQLGPVLRRFLLEALLVVLVLFATSSRRHVHESSGALPCFRRQVFFALKSGLVLLLAFLLSVDLCQPLQAAFPLALDLLQTLLAAILAIAGLRWSFGDQEARCKQCLRALQSPARVGRPSRNLLEWNGTEQVCRQGHGRLNLPEMETSWCRSGRWLSDRQQLA